MSANNNYLYNQVYEIKFTFKHNSNELKVSDIRNVFKHKNV